MTIRGGAGPAVNSVLHSYLLGDRRTPPVLVFAQSIERDQTEATLRNLLGHADRPEHVELLGEDAETVEIDGVAHQVVRRHWSDDRVSGVSFRRHDLQVAVTSWKYPLDREFFASLGVVGSGI